MNGEMTPQRSVKERPKRNGREETPEGKEKERQKRESFRGRVQ
jgi:hypothetical protein